MFAYPALLVAALLHLLLFPSRVPTIASAAWEFGKNRVLARLPAWVYWGAGGAGVAALAARIGMAGIGPKTWLGRPGAWSNEDLPVRREC